MERRWESAQPQLVVQNIDEWETDNSKCGPGASDDELAGMRDMLWRAQMRWDYVSANNGAGFHSPQESARILGGAIDLAQKVRVEAVRALAKHGYTDPESYPDVFTKQKALAVITQFEKAAQDPKVSVPSLLSGLLSPVPDPAVANDEASIGSGQPARDGDTQTPSTHGEPASAAVKQETVLLE